MPSVRRNQHGGLTYTPAQEKALRRAKAGGMIRNLAHSTARGLRDRNLGEITAKDDGRGELMPNGHRLMTRQFPTVTFRLNGAGVAEAALTCYRPVSVPPPRLPRPWRPRRPTSAARPRPHRHRSGGTSPIPVGNK